MTTLRQRLSTAGLFLTAFVLAIALGWLVPHQPLLALVTAGALLFIGLSALDSGLVPLVALPLLYVSHRIGANAVNVSLSDVALAGGAGAALLWGRRPYSLPLRNLLWLIAIYQVATLFTVVAHPYAANTIEWVHTWVLIGGGLVLGWSVGRGGHGQTGLKLMLLTASILAAWVVVQAGINLSRGSLEPVYLPYGMHKNFLGTMLGITALIAYIRPSWLGLNRHLALAAFWWLVLGVAFTQSRQAIIALVVALVVLVLRSRTDRRRSKAILLAAIPALLVVFTLVRDQVTSGNRFNSVFQRLTWFEDAIVIWGTDPLLGVGLRWWYTDRFPGGFQPPNSEIEVLTSAGIIGLAGFLVLMIGSIVVLWRVEPTYGALALLAVLSRFVQGQLDLFWVAAQTSIPFVIVGICLGVQALHENDGVTMEALTDTEDTPERPTVKASMP